MHQRQTRRIIHSVAQDLTTKMVFIAGPRQCGKTTLAKKFLTQYSGRYYNWDEDLDRRMIMESKLDLNKDLWIFDELHKYRNWRNWLKGKFDTLGADHRILVTGSAKLDLYNKGGDSLQGRYFLHRLHPFTLSEVLGIEIADNIDSFFDYGSQAFVDAESMLKDMLKLGGFPEPLFSGSERSANRWRISYGARLIREDIRSLENIHYLDKMELLYYQLPHTVSSTLSINSLREDLELSFDTVRDWVNIFEKNYICFRLAPLGGTKILKKIRAVKKEAKLYYWDWAIVEDMAARFENLVAFHLLRFNHWLQDEMGLRTELRYFRDTRKHEVDFVFLHNSKPWFAVEVKQSAQSLDANMRYLLERVKFKYAFQVHLQGDDDYRMEDINGAKVFIMPASKFLQFLP